MHASHTLIISNLGVGDCIFANDFGTWNVSRALRDCAAGKHKCYKLDVAEAHAANAAVEVDEAKVERFMRTPDVFKSPLLGVIEGGPLWIIDGHHRLRALHRAGVKEETDAKPYQVWFNGKRLMPKVMK